jgi:heme iron utilization protein
MPDDLAPDVRRWLIESRVATFATLSVDARCAGSPFCSIVPYALDARGRPIVQIASIAAHTQNVKADPRASLFVHEGAADPQAGWRVTLVGRMKPVPAAENEEALARLVERVPKALEYEATHDFSLWRLDIEHVRCIAGFGRIAWVDAATVVRDPLGAGLSEAAPGAVAHMNADHAESMREMCTGLAGFTPARAEAVAIDRTGMLVRCKEPDRLVHFSFGREIDAAALRTAVVDIVKRARK